MPSAPVYKPGNVGYLAGQLSGMTCDKLCQSSSVISSTPQGTCAYVSNRWNEGGSPDLTCSSTNQNGSNCYCCPKGTLYSASTDLCLPLS